MRWTTFNDLMDRAELFENAADVLLFATSPFPFFSREQIGTALAAARWAKRRHRAEAENGPRIP